MALNKEYWLSFHFKDGTIPEISCPTCKVGKLLRFEKFLVHQTKKSRNQIEHYWSDQLDFEAKFAGLLICGNENCKDIISVSGHVFTEPDEPIYDKDGGITQPFFQYFKPEFFSPPIEIFPLKKEYPSSVKKYLKKSFILFFNDNESCGNKIRISIEALLDELRVKKTFITTSHKRKALPLHQRIYEYGKKNPFLAELMKSIKWIGNYGSHKETLTNSDLLDAYITMITILDYIYDNQEKKLLKQAKTINKNKKPMSKLKTKNPKSHL